MEQNDYTKLIVALGKIRQSSKTLSYGEFKELLLTNMQYAFARNYNGESVIVTVNNGDGDHTMTLPAGNAAEYVGKLSGTRVAVNNGCITVNVKGNSGDIWMPAGADETVQPVNLEIKTEPAKVKEPVP